MTVSISSWKTLAWDIIKVLSKDFNSRFEILLWNIHSINVFLNSWHFDENKIFHYAKISGTLLSANILKIHACWFFLIVYNLFVNTVFITFHFSLPFPHQLFRSFTFLLILSEHCFLLDITTLCSYKI